ncbi:MAG TPA: CPBP family intramembrane glutamic endopeptidase [Polyangia bacterium]
MTREAVLAPVCVAVWAAAAASSARLGIWLGLGGCAIALGLVAWTLDRARLRVELRPTLRSVVAGTVVGVAMSAATHLLYPPVARAAPFVAGDTARLYAAFRATSLPVAALVLVPVVLGEELVWRGVVQGAIVRRAGPRAGVGLAALVYALAHGPAGAPLLVVVALGCGLVWGALRAATGSLVPSLVAHLVWDTLVLLAWPLDAR